MELRGPNMTRDELEYILGKVGAIETEIKDDPRPAVSDKLFRDLADNNDWWSASNLYSKVNKSNEFSFCESFVY